MGFFMFNARKPRGFQHNYIYVDERKEKLKQIEENAKRDLGMLPPKEFKPEDLRGKFSEHTKHLKKYKKRHLSFQTLIVLLAIAIFILHYLMTGKFSF